MLFRSYILFGGGDNTKSTYYATVDAYNSSLTRSTPTELNKPCYKGAAASIKEYALFGGGYFQNLQINGVTAYNASLIRSIPDSLSKNREFLAAASVGNYVLFGGGYGGEYIGDGNYYATVDVYTVE